MLFIIYIYIHMGFQIMMEMEAMVARCPTGHICETYVIGQTREGRDQKVLKVGNKEKEITFYCRTD